MEVAQIAEKVVQTGCQTGLMAGGGRGGEELRVARLDYPLHLHKFLPSDTHVHTHTCTHTRTRTNTLCPNCGKQRDTDKTFSIFHIAGPLLLRSCMQGRERQAPA